MNYCQIILQNGCHNLYFRLHCTRVSGSGFLNNNAGPFLKEQSILQFYFQSTHNFLYWCTQFLQCSLVYCQPSVRFSLPSPILRRESLPRVKASCFCCFWQNHSLPVMESICFTPFVRLYVPEMGRGLCVRKIMSFRITQPWSPGFES